MLKDGFGNPTGRPQRPSTSGEYDCVYNMATIKTPTKHTRVRASSRKTPVTTPLAGMVPNSTGGHNWVLGPWDQFSRFLVLGTEGGTYYIGEAKLVEQNHDTVAACIKEDGVRAVNRITEVSTKGLAYRTDPAIYALALVFAHGTPEAKMAATAALPQVCRTGTHLMHFAQYANSLRGWGRGLRRAVAGWYLDRPADQLAFQAVKYQNRDGWSHRDLLRLVHPKTEDVATEAVFRWIQGGAGALDGRKVVRKVGGEEITKTYEAVTQHLPGIIDAFEKAKAATKAAQIVTLIQENNLPREAIPTQFLNEVSVWEALLERMPLTAMIRNLGKMTSIGLVKPLSAATKLVRERLGNRDYLRKSRIHPLAVLVASKVYAQGHGVKGNLSWTAVPAVSEALDKAFYATFDNVRPTGKPLLIALDVSGSMTSPISGSVLSSCEAVAALSLVHASVEDEVHTFGFAHEFVELGIQKGMTLPQACRVAQKSNFGSTNCSLAVEYAIKEKLEVGGFIVMTDGECNAGPHLNERLLWYRERFVADARCVFVATCSNRFTLNDPKDKYGLDVAGFDPSVPALVADFIREDLGTSAAEVADVDE